MNKKKNLKRNHNRLAVTKGKKFGRVCGKGGIGD